MCREAGKTLPNALGDVREAVDFLRYYAKPDSPAIFPMRRTARSASSPASAPGIFRSRYSPVRSSAALAAGNAVIAKPAEETPLVAAEAVRLLHEAGRPEHVAAIAGGRWRSRRGADRCTADVAGVLFTGSTEVARIIQRALAQTARRRTARRFR